MRRSARIFSIGRSTFLFMTIRSAISPSAWNIGSNMSISITGCSGPVLLTTQDHNGYVLNRVMPHFDLHAGGYFRFFTELKFDFTSGRNGGPRPGIDEDRGDVHQAFIEI